MKERIVSENAFDPDQLIFKAEELSFDDFQTRGEKFHAAGQLYESAYRLYPENAIGKKANAVLESMANYVQARELDEASRFGREALMELGNSLSPMERYDIQERIHLAEIQLGK